MKYNKISIVIPATNEIAHIERSVKSALSLTDRVYVVDSFSTDGTKEVAEQLGAKVVEYEWTLSSTFARKMNWALLNIPFETEWVMRLDADEYLVGDWEPKIKGLMESIPSEVNGVNIYRRLYFLGRWMRHRDNYPRPQMRILRVGHVEFEDRMLDEHIDLKGGGYLQFPLEIADNPKVTMSKWIEKHNAYSTKEAIMAVDAEVGLSNKEVKNNRSFDGQAQKIKKQKSIYSKVPPYWRGFFYFCYRFFFKLGFLDGREGFLWDFYHAWWYRNLVDTKVDEMYAICGKDREKLKEYILKEYNIKL